MPPSPTIACQGPHPALLDWLVKRDIEAEVYEHTETLTARETARAEGIDLRTLAKVVGVATDDGRNVLLVLDATGQVDLHKARRALSARDVRLLDEAELARLTPGCDTGAIPAVGALFDLPMYADYVVRVVDGLHGRVGARDRAGETPDGLGRRVIEGCGSLGQWRCAQDARAGIAQPQAPRLRGRCGWFRR